MRSLSVVVIVSPLILEIKDCQRLEHREHTVYTANEYVKPLYVPSGVGWFTSSLGYPRSEMVVVVLVRGGNGSAASAVGGEFYRALLGVSPQTTTTLAAAPGAQ
jgi:hypothetical protein